MNALKLYVYVIKKTNECIKIICVCHLVLLFSDSCFRVAGSCILRLLTLIKIFENPIYLKVLQTKKSAGVFKNPLFLCTLIFNKHKIVGSTFNATRDGVPLKSTNTITNYMVFKI